MPAPNDFPCFPVGVSIIPIAGGQYTLSQALVDLLINARNGYDGSLGSCMVCKSLNFKQTARTRQDRESSAEKHELC